MILINIIKLSLIEIMEEEFPDFRKKYYEIVNLLFSY